MKYSSCLVLLAVIVLAALFRVHAANPATAGFERTITRTFPVQPGGTLHLETQGGNISVQSSADGVVKITAREKIRAGSETEADELLQRLTLDLGQHGDDVTGRAKYEAIRPDFHSGSWPPVQVDFFVTLPPGFSVELDSSGGRVAVADLAGSVRVHTGGGELNLGRIKGTVEAATGGGSVRIASVENSLRLSTGGGSVVAEISGALSGDCEVQTAGGSLRLTVDRTTAFTLDAVTSGSTVEADGLPITVASSGAGRGQLAGSVNGGGPRLKLRSGSGSIELLAR